MYGTLERVEKLAADVSQMIGGHRECHLHESDTALEEDLLDDLRHLKSIGREIQERFDIRKTVVSEEGVDTEVTSIIGHLINWIDQ